jgi:hypothetical protein
MQKVHSAETLRAAIVALENKQREEGQLLKTEFNLAYDSLKPINLIIGLVKEVGESEEIKNSLVNTSVGLGAGLLTRKIFESTSRSPFKRMIGTALQYGVTNTVSHHPEVVKMVGNGISALFSLILAHRAKKRLAKKVGLEKTNGVVHAWPDIVE